MPAGWVGRYVQDPASIGPKGGGPILSATGDSVTLRTTSITVNAQLQRDKQVESLGLFLFLRTTRGFPDTTAIWVLQAAAVPLGARFLNLQN